MLSDALQSSESVFNYKNVYPYFLLIERLEWLRMANLEQTTLRQIINENFYRIDQRLSEMTQQIDKLADRDMLRIDRTEQVKLRVEELSEEIGNLVMRMNALEQWSSAQKMMIRHGVTVIIVLVIIALYAAWNNGF